MRYRNGIGIALVLLAIAPALAMVTVNPQKYEIKSLEFNRTYNVIVTLINQDAFPYEVQVVVGKNAYYLASAVQIEPTHFRLAANEKENVKLALVIPDNLSPEEHTLTLQFLAANQELGIFTLSFNVPGEQMENLVINKVDVTRSDEIAYFNFDLSNAGNVIARGSPIIELSRDQEIVHSFGQESSILVLPREHYNLSLMYDTTATQPGAYTYKAYVRYNDMDSNIKTGDFVIEQVTPPDEAEAIHASVGDVITIPVLIQNQGGKLSFYRIAYTVDGIEYVVEGPLQESSKEVPITIDTSALTDGTHPVMILVKSGRNLESSQSRSLNVVLGRRFNLLYLAPIPAIGLVIALALLLRPHLVSRRRHRSFVDEVSVISDDYDRLEQSLKGLSKDIHVFIDESNHWLAARGYRHGFR
jgi:hypothetical protein